MTVFGSRIAERTGVGERTQRRGSRASLTEIQREVGIARIERQQVMVQEVLGGKAELQVLMLLNRKALLRRQIAVPVHGTVEARHTGIADARTLKRESEAFAVDELVLLQTSARIAGDNRSHSDIR